MKVKHRFNCYDCYELVTTRKQQVVTVKTYINQLLISLVTIVTMILLFIAYRVKNILRNNINEKYINHKNKICPIRILIDFAIFSRNIVTNQYRRGFQRF